MHIKLMIGSLSRYIVEDDSINFDAGSHLNDEINSSSDNNFSTLEIAEFRKFFGWDDYHIIYIVPNELSIIKSFEYWIKIL